MHTQLWLFALLHILMPEGFCCHKIVGGRVSAPHSHPYMVYVRDPYTELKCGGFLVSREFVLTAAHCYSPRMLVFFGVNDTSTLKANNGLFVKPFPHSNFNRTSFENDIMLLKLEKPVTFSKNVQAIALPKLKHENFTRRCLVMGWGSRAHECSCPSHVLLEAEVNVTKVKACLARDMMCSRGCIGPSRGDSGGPLVCGDVAQGIVSNYLRHRNCYKSRYVRISLHLNWIQETMNKTSNPSLLQKSLHDEEKHI